MTIFDEELKDRQVTIYYKDHSQYGSNAGVGRKDGIFLEINNNTIVMKSSMGIIEGIPLHNVIRFIIKPDREENNE